VNKHSKACFTPPTHPLIALSFGLTGEGSFAIELLCASLSTQDNQQ
jgi:hypothetical protein